MLKYFIELIRSASDTESKQCEHYDSCSVFSYYFAKRLYQFTMPLEVYKDVISLQPGLNFVKIYQV